MPTFISSFLCGLVGTSANDVHFQAFLLDEITRWNTARTSSSIDAPVSPLRSLDIDLKNKLHLLSSSVMGVPLDPCFRPPSTYRGELLGVEYLYGENAQTLSLDVDKDIDEGIGEDEVFFPPAETEDFDPELEIACGSFVNRYIFSSIRGFINHQLQCFFYFIVSCRMKLLVVTSAQI